MAERKVQGASCMANLRFTLTRSQQSLESYLLLNTQRREHGAGSVSSAHSESLLSQSGPPQSRTVFPHGGRGRYQSDTSFRPQATPPGPEITRQGKGRKRKSRPPICRRWPGPVNPWQALSQWVSLCGWWTCRATVQHAQSAPRSHVGWSPGRTSRGSPRDPCKNGSPVHEGKAGVLGRARPVLALPRRQRRGRGPVPEAEELVRGQLPPAVGKSREAATRPCVHPHLRVGFEGQGHELEVTSLTVRYQTLEDIVVQCYDFAGVHSLSVWLI